jgi:hypothetical protein
MTYLSRSLHAAGTVIRQAAFCRLAVQARFGAVAEDLTAVLISNRPKALFGGIAGLGSEVGRGWRGKLTSMRPAAAARCIRSILEGNCNISAIESTLLRASQREIASIRFKFSLSAGLKSSLPE